MAENAPAPSQQPMEDQVRQQTGQQQVRLRLDERAMTSNYANAFRANGTAEEVMLDFGVNVLTPAQHEGDQPEILFTISNRIILNYYSAKRLAITLSQLIRRHEQQFGELELDAAKRRKE